MTKFIDIGRPWHLVSNIANPGLGELHILYFSILGLYCRAQIIVLGFQESF